MSYKKSGRTELVDVGGTYIPPRQLESSGDCGDDITSLPKQSPSQPLQPSPAAGADGSVTGRAGDLTLSPSPPGSARQKGNRPGKAKKSLSTGATPKKGRVGKRESHMPFCPGAVPGQNSQKTKCARTKNIAPGQNISKKHFTTNTNHHSMDCTTYLFVCSDWYPVHFLCVAGHPDYFFDNSVVFRIGSKSVIVRS